MDPQAQLVEQAVVEKGLAEWAVAVHHQIAATLVFELTHRDGGVGADDGRVRPGRLFERAGEHVLRDLVHPIGVVAH
jgi:hypothetical protein